MQIVLLHAGAGLAQGSMAIAASRALETTDAHHVRRVEAAYGETDFDPGSQWYRNLGVVGGAHRIVEPMVKWAQSIPSYETLYHSVLRAGEMAQRTPKGPTYLCVSMETLLQQGETAVGRRIAPSAPERASNCRRHQSGRGSDCRRKEAVNLGPDLRSRSGNVRCPGKIGEHSLPFPSSRVLAHSSAIFPSPTKCTWAPTLSHSLNNATSCC